MARFDILNANDNYAIYHGDKFIGRFNSWHDAVAWINKNVCECCESAIIYRDGVCKDCEHPDDADFWEFDPGAEF